MRERLVAHAGELLSSGGAAALSVRKVARAAGTSTAAVYSLFGGRRGLIEALFTNAFTRFADGQMAVAATDDPLGDLVRLGVAYRRSAVADPNGYRVMFGGEVRPSDVGRAAAEQAGRTFEPVLGAVQRAVDLGAFPAEPSPGAIATALWGNVHGLVSLELGGFLPPLAGNPGEIFETAVRAVVDGWASRTST